MIMQGPELNPENVIRQIEKILVGRNTWNEYWEHIQTCTTPRLAAGGHYVEQAKKLTVKTCGPLIDVYAPVKETPIDRCLRCGGGGMLSLKQCCDCSMGEEIARISSRKKPRTSAPGMSRRESA
jgi:hypothetical protein